MDFNENNGERLFEARNENSVLFSLDSLNALDKESDGNDGGLNTNSEASGLINLNMLTQISGEDTSGFDDTKSPMSMGSMTFNQVVTKKSKRNLAIVIGAFVIVIIAASIIGYQIYQSGQEQLAENDTKAQSELKEIGDANTQLESKNQALEDKIKQLESDTATLNQKDEEIAKLQEQLRNLQLNGAAPPTTNDRPSGKGGGSGAKGGNNAGAGDAPAAPPKPSGAKADPNAIKAALADANKKAAKCAKGGTLNIAFSLSGSGKASGVKAVGGTFKGTPSEKCVLTVFEKYSYPTFSGPTIPVKYTVKL
jgi:hypothetical protein